MALCPGSGSDNFIAFTPLGNLNGKNVMDSAGGDDTVSYATTCAGVNIDPGLGNG